MNRSETISELAKALATAQAKIKPAVKDSENPFFTRADRRATYATLASVWEACRVPLSESGLSIIQAPEYSNFEDGTSTFILETYLVHSSGEWVCSEYPVRPVKDDPQGLGSALTYARRYALMAMVGIAPEDDDGNAASGKPAVGTEEAQGVVMEEKLKDLKAKEEARHEPTYSSQRSVVETITVPQGSRLYAIAKSSGWTDEQLKIALLGHFGYRHTKEVSKAKYKEVCEYFEHPPDEGPKQKSEDIPF